MKKPSLEDLKARAEAGDVVAMMKLASIYGSDDNEDYDLDGPNKTEAMKWYEKASNSGDAEATYYLSMYYDDETDEINLLKKAANMGHDEAHHDIGLLYRNRGDFKNALYWFKTQYDNAEANPYYRKSSAYEIGSLYENRGYYKDYRMAVKWYKIAAKMGSSSSARRLGEMYENGVRSDEYIEDVLSDGHTIIHTDMKEAAKWYLFAAENGNEWDCAKMSDLYLNGIGVIRNYPKAFLWMLKAACGIFPSYKVAVSSYFENGIGLDQNIFEAYIWALLANDSFDSDKLHELEKELSKTEIHKAQKEAEYRSSLIDGFSFSKDLHKYMLARIKSADITSIKTNAIKPEKPALHEDEKGPSNGSDSSASKSAMNTPSQKMHRSGLDYSSWKVGKINDIKVTLYLRDATITLSYKNKKDTQPADKLFSKNSLRLLILAYDFIQKGHPKIKKTDNSIASAAYPNKDMADCLPNNRVVTYFNSDFRKLFGLSKKDKAFDWDGGKYNSNLVSNIIFEVKP
ncbi:MAG: tetratricopeptide repeat protein [Sphaerochaetaceae bacterium]|nr:tetratricopeptide repeat protein [Sphaerochaetaceae bacterium]